MDYYEKIIILLGFLVLIVYFIFYFDLNTILRNIGGSISPAEGFNSYLFQPRKIFQNNGKIYLLDTQRVLEIDRNPLIFDNYIDYQKYLLNIENELREDLEIKIGKKKVKLEEIQEEEIPSIDFKFKNIKEIDANNPYYKNYTCQRQSAYCELKENKDPFFHSIHNPESLREFQDKVCKKKLLTPEQCEIIKEFRNNNSKINEICNNKGLILPEFQNDFSIICEKNKVIQNNDELLKNVCNKNSTYLDNCLLDDYFREEILTSLSK